MPELRDSTGKHFIIGLRPSIALSDPDRRLLSELRPAGIVLFKSNFDHSADYEGWLESVDRLVCEARDAIGRANIIVGIDHEGGRVCRTPNPITRFRAPSNWSEQAAEVGAAMGKELASLGVNLNFAPLLDIASNPDNPVIGDRAFSSDANAVARAAVAFFTAMQANGVTACGKHFPGHGDTSLDSHYDLPELNLTLPELHARELVPFKRAIEQGMSAIMTSHIMFPRIDPTWPATLSEKLVRQLLRRDLGFDGLVMSDDVGMHAMDSFFDDVETIVRFMSAGNDMLMLCSHWTETDRALDFARALEGGLEQRTLDTALMDAAGRRIDHFLQELSDNRVQRLPVSVFGRHARSGPLFGGGTAEVV